MRQSNALALRMWARVFVAFLARGALLTFTAAILWSALPSLVGWHTETVMTGSMEPRLEVGNVAISVPVSGSEHLATGKILLFHDPDHPGRLRFHRLVGVDSHGELITKGDANPTVDSTHVSRSAVIGVGVVRIPLIGLPKVWIATGDVLPLSLFALGLGLAVLLSFADSSLLDGAKHSTSSSTPDARGALPPNRLSAREAIAGLLRRPVPGRHGSRPGIGSVLYRVSAGLMITVVAAAVVTSALRSGDTGATFSSVSANSANQFTSCAYFTPPTATTPTIGGVAPEFLAQLDEGTGTTTANTGSKPAGTTASSPAPTLGTGTTWNPTCTDHSTSVHFNGTATATISTPYYAANSYSSLGVWIRTTSTTGGRIAGQDVTTASGSVGVGTSKALYLGANGEVGFFVRKWSSGTSAYYNITSTTAVNDGNWHLICVEQNNGSMIMEIDAGTQIQAPETSADNYTSSTTPAYWNLGAGSLTGASLATTSTSFVGDIDKVSISEQNYSQAEATAMYNAGH